MQLQSPLAGVTPTLDGDVLQVLAQTSRFSTLPRIVQRVPDRSRSGIVKVLDRLVAQGVVLREDVGGVRTYELNRDHVLAPAIVELAGARDRLIGLMRERCAVMPVAYAALFGSAARGDMRPDSDIDLFFAVDAPERTNAEEEIFELASELRRRTGNTVNPVVYDVEAISADDPLIGSIATEGLALTADRRWLATHLREARA